MSSPARSTRLMNLETKNRINRRWHGSNVVLKCELSRYPHARGNYDPNRKVVKSSIVPLTVPQTRRI